MAQTTALIDTLRRAGFQGPALRTAYAIMMRESRGNPRAFNGNRGTGDQSYGLFQINMLGDMGPARRREYGLSSNDDLYDPFTNARAAYRLSKGGTDFGAWGLGPNAYRKGAGFDTIRQWWEQFPGAGPGGLTPVPVEAPGQAPTKPSPDLRSQLAMQLIDRSRARRGADPLSASPLAQAFASRQQPPVQQVPSRQPLEQPSAGGSTVAGRGGIRELFYDPLGAYDEGSWIKPIGGHSDHVHVSFGSPQAAMAAIRYAQQLGLRTSENPWAEGSPAEKGVHTGTSYHYRTFSGQFKGGKSPALGMGLDVSGDPARMAQFFRWVKQHI